MNYTNKQLIAICEEARKNHLWNGKGYQPWGKTKFVCHALGRANRIITGDGGTPPQLKKLVQAHIGNHYMMESFLKRKLGESKVDNATAPQIQAWRFLMLDSIIKMLKKEGKK